MHPSTGPASPASGLERLTLPKAARVRRRSDFLTIQARGARLPSRHFLLVHDDSPSGAAEIGITVTKKIGNSPERNTIKRQVREVFRMVRRGLPVPRRVVIVARQGASELTSAQMRCELQDLFTRLGRQLSTDNPNSAAP